jgi:HEPN domain-containing protein
MRPEYSKADIAPRFLTPEEIENPYQVIHDLYSYDHLPGIREKMKQWTRLTFTGNYNHELQRVERANLAYYIEHIEKLIEASHIIHERKHGSMLRRIINKKKFSDSVVYNDVLFFNPKLKRVTKIILDHTNAEKIYLLRAELNDDAEDAKPFYDILVLIPDSNQTKFEELKKTISRSVEDHANLSLLLVKAKHAYQLLSEGHLFYSFAVKTEKILFDDGEAAMPCFKVPDEVLIENAKRSFDAGMKKAQVFLGSVTVCKDQKDYSLALFMLHQAAEICYRTIVNCLNGVELSTHHLKELMEQAHHSLPAIATIFPKEEKFQKWIQLMQEAYTKGRYSLDFDPGIGVIDIIFKKLELLLQQTKDEFEIKICELKRSDSE